LDLDNTLINYGPAYGFLLSEVLKEERYESQSFDKESAKRLILERKGNLEWTEAQGKLYSKYLSHAEFFPGAFDFLREARISGYDVVIVSHKTKFPYEGERVDLQACAISWLHSKLPSDILNLEISENLFFEETKKAKIDRISELGCEVFVDDLEEILRDLPLRIMRILFRGSSDDEDLVTATSWSEVRDLILCR
jgi:hypothetical protein